jgi:Ca-activated chloride channel homolog
MTRPCFLHCLSVSLCLVLVLAALPAASRAQLLSADDVHVVPRRVSGALAARSNLPDPALDLKGKHLKVDVDLVLVPVAVTDSLNRPVVDLPQQDFALSEDGVAQQIRHFSREDTPISVGLVLDLSGSMKNKIEYVRQAVQRFFDNANPEDDYFAIAVSSRPELIAASPDSLEILERQLTLATPRGGTSLWDSIYLGVARLRSARYARRALLIISDGGDNSSHYTVNEIKSVVAESDVLVYAIGIFDQVPIPLFQSWEERWGRKWLDEVTGISGGRDIPADKRTKMPEIAAIISRELRNQYVLGYRSSNLERDGKWRRIKVSLNPAVSPSTRLQAFYKKGYYAPDALYSQVR